MPDQTQPTLPSHIEDTVRSIVNLHLEHHRKSTPVQLAVDRMTSFVGQPRFVGLMTAAFSLWVAANLALHFVNRDPLDPLPFPWLETFATLMSLYITVLILITQRRENNLAEHRDQLTLQLAILSERESAKIIELREELRRDHPEIHDRADPEAKEMSTAADPQVVLKAIDDAATDYQNDAPV